MRVYYGLNEGSDESQADIQNLATFIGYKGKHVSLGAEYNRIWNYKNKDGRDLNGFSIYGNVKMNKNADLYLRYDDFDGGDETAFIAGVQWKVGKYVKLSPNLRWKNNDYDGGEPDTFMGYISCYFGF